MLCAEVDEDEDADRIVAILEETSSVDMDERQNSWRQEGWSGQSQFGQGQSGQSQFAQGQTGASGTRDNVVEEERIPLIQEELRVGKREVERGGARVRSYVEERPVSEQVNLREEHVSIERHPVDQQLSSSDFADRTFCASAASKCANGPRKR
jgi:stress response protein YsnF